MSDADTDLPLGYLSPKALAHPQPVYRKLQQGCPVRRMIPGAGHFLFKYDDVLFALKHPEIFSAAVETGMLGNDRPLIPLQIDPPGQTRYRKLLDPFFLRKRVKAMEPDLRSLVNRTIDGFIDRGECEFHGEFAVPYPCTVFLRLFGLPQSDLDMFLGLKDGIIRPASASFEEAQRVREETGRRIYDYFDALLDERRTNPKEDFLSYLVTSSVDGVKLTRDEVKDVCFLFLIAGLDTVTATLGCAFAYLAQHPDRRREIVRNPALIEHAVEELMRWDTPVMQVVRVMARDHVLNGVKLEKGERVTLVLGAANVDPEHFEDPLVVDFARESNRHLAFGGGNHRCMGSHLARMELQVSIEEFHRRIPEYHLEEGAAPVYSPAIREVSNLPLVFGPAKG
jgi:cytochrome P450